MRMSPAELSVRRRTMGLTTEQLAERLGNNPRTVRSWEQGRDVIPERLRDDLHDLEAEFTELVDRLADEDRVVYVAHKDTWTLAALGCALRAEPDLMIEWAD